MKLDRLPVGEGIIGFLLVAMFVTFILAGDTIGTPANDDIPGEPTPTEPANGDNGGELEIVMTDNVFAPADLTIPADTDVSIPLINDGAAIHNIQVATADGDYPATFCTLGGAAPCSDPARMNGGTTGVINLNLPAGVYPFRCDYHPIEMVGTITAE